MITQHLLQGKFIKIRKGEKAPEAMKDEDWNTLIVDFDKANKFLKEGFNVGLVAGEGIIIIDADKPESVGYCDKQLPLTLTEETCSGGKHFFYTTNNVIKNTTIPNRLGEIRCSRQYVVIAPSKALNKQKELKEYKVIRDIPMANITQLEIDNLISFFSKVEVEEKLIQKEVDTTFVSENVLPFISSFVKDLIVKKKTKEDLQVLGYPSRSERDMKVVNHLLNKGFGEYIFSIFKHYPCGDKFKEHPSGEKYLKKTIEESIGFLRLRTKGDMELETQIEGTNPIWLKRQLDEILFKISNVKDNTNLFKESLISTLAFRTKMSQNKLEKRLKELIDESKPRQMITMFDLLQTDFVPQDYWVNPLIPKGTIIIIGAKPGVGKSLLIQALMTSITTTGQFIGYKCEKVPKVILYSVDDSSEKMLHERNVHIINGLKATNPLFNPNGLKELKTSFSFLKSNLRKEIDIALGYDIILLDSYRRVLKGEENNSETTDVFFNEFLKPLKDVGKTIIILHHLRKTNLEEVDDSELQDTLRGSGDVVSQVDLAFILVSSPLQDQPPLMDIKDCTLKIVKNRLGIPFRDLKDNLTSNVCYRVIKDLTKHSTVFEYLDPSSLKSSKERRKDAILNLLVKHNSLTREHIVSHISKALGCSRISVEKDIDNMWKSGEILKEKFGSYSIRKDGMEDKK